MSKQTGLLSLTMAKAIEAALNQAIRLDEMQGREFEPLEDSVIALYLSDIKLGFHFLFTSYGVTVSSVQSENPQPVDSTIETTIAELASLPKRAGLPNCVLTGDVIKAEQFIHALANIEIDWEEHLSHYTGDLIAFKVGHGVRSLLQAKQSFKQQAGETLKEYLQFELQTLPTQSQVNHFNQQVGATATEFDALEQRINQLFKP